LIVYF